MKKLLLFLSWLALSGCAATYNEPQLPTDHPANAAAQATPPPSRSHTLDIPTVTPIVPAPPDTGADKQQQDAATPQSPESAATYACPMHPEVTSDKADARCPKCGMKLKKVDGGKHP